MSRRSNGTGTIYQRGDIWWVKIHVDGKPVYQSSGSAKKADAVRLRDKLLGKKSRGELASGSPDRVRIGELLDDLLKRYETDAKPGTLEWARMVVDVHLRPYFAEFKAARLTTAMLNQYRAARLTGVSNATVNRELAVLRIAFNDGRKVSPPKVILVPYFPMVREDDNVRQGFLDHATYIKLREALPTHQRVALVLGYYTGMRLEEVLSLQWSQVDLDAREIRLHGGRALGSTKNRESRVVPIYQGMEKELKAAYAVCPPGVPWVVSFRGKRIYDIREGWEPACAIAGVPDLLFHDLRRSAAMNLDRAGVSMTVAMKIIGHKTDSMWRRYRIVVSSDLTDARDKMNAQFPDE
jgi:integrase